VNPEGEPLDPAEVEERRKSVYVSKKELGIVAVMGVLLLFGFFLLYRTLKQGAEESVCTRNMKEIFTALGLYLQDNNDRFPPVFVRDAEDAPMLERGHPVTWVTQIHANFSRRASFRCPTAGESELAANRGNRDDIERVDSAYGFYVAREFAEQPRIAYPSEVVLVAETSNRGARRTFDPHPLLDASGSPLASDGFAIGWDTGNALPEPGSRFVTRLAFPESAGARFSEKGESRHRNGIHALTVDGSLRWIKPPAARLERIGEDVAGLWSVR